MTYCSNCGKQVEGAFCPNCGQAQQAAPPPPGGAYAPPPGQGYQAGPPPAGADMADNVAGALCYLFGFITGVIFLVLSPYNANRAIRFHAFQSIFINVSIIALWIAFMILAVVLNMIPVLGAIISLLLSLALGLGGFGLWLYMMLKTYNGERIVLPVIGPMAEKQAMS